MCFAAKIIRISMLSLKLYRLIAPVFVVMTIFIVVACSSDKFVPDGQYLLDKVELHSDKKDVNSSLLMQYVRQKVIHAGSLYSRYH